MILVLTALLLVGVFGVLGFVVDGGRLRVTKQQMDAGVEAAALEGVRFKDEEGDESRRRRAQTALELQWDDDLRTGNGDAIGLGAGTLPIVTGANPVGGLVKAPLDPAEQVWKPGAGVQQNLGNAAFGDFVAGSFLSGTIEPKEADDFSRNDFLPVAAGSPATSLEAAPAFLVRLRRANNRLALDRQPGASSAGPAFEWLWARGSAWQEPGEGEGIQSRADGWTVRATGIATTERALFVSSVPELGVIVAPFALRIDAGATWATTTVGQSIVLTRDANGVLLLGGSEQGVLPTARPTTVSNYVAPEASAALLAPSGVLVVPVYAPIDGAQRVVVGFTRATAVVAGNELTVTRVAGGVLSTGSSSVSPAALDARVALSLSSSLRALHDAFLEPVSAPVLRR